MRFWQSLPMLLLVYSAFGQRQVVDNNYDARVAHPAYVSEHPRVSIDEGHLNFHTADGRYKPLAELLRSDGYNVSGSAGQLTAAALNGTNVLIISNALGPGAGAGSDASPPAFKPAECDAVRAWVMAGGSLLLIADHTPFGTAADMMARALGTTMGRGFVYTLDDRYRDAGRPAVLVFSRENGLLGDHPITRGRNESERINRVVAFTGQSLSFPADATPLMKLSPDAHEARDHVAFGAVFRNLAAGVSTESVPGVSASPKGAAQGIAYSLGKGRVVVLGEAALMSAQVVRSPDGRETKMGMNAAGNDDRQFALNVMHWLSRLLN